MKSKTQSSLGPKMLMSVAVTLLLAGQGQAVNQEQHQQVNVQQLHQNKQNLDLDKKNKHFKKNMKLFVQLDNKKIHQTFNYEVDPSNHSVIEISEEIPNENQRAQGILEDIASSTPANAASVKTTIVPTASAPANAASVIMSKVPAPMVNVPIFNAPLESITNNTPPTAATVASTVTTVAPTVQTVPVMTVPTVQTVVPVMSAPASVIVESDDGRVGPPIAQNATHEVVPVKEIEEREVQKVDPVTNEVKTEIVKMEVIKNKAVEKGAKISKDGSETKTVTVGDEIVTVKKKMKKSAVKAKIAKEKEDKKEIEITTNDDDTDDEVVKKIEEKIGKKLKPSQKKKAIQVVKLKKQVIKMNKDDQEKGSGPGGNGGDLDEDIDKKDEKADEPEIKIDKNGNVSLKPKETKDEKDEKDQEEKDEAEVKEVLKANALKEAKKVVVIKANAPKKDVKKVGPPIAQNATHEVVPVIVDVPKAQADGTIVMEKVVKNKAIPKEKAPEVIGAPIAQNATHEVVPVLQEVNKELEDGTIVTEKVVKNKAIPKKVPIASPVPLAIAPAAVSSSAATPVGPPVAQNSTHEVVPVIEEEIKDVPKVQADGTVKIEKVVEKVVKNKVIAKKVTIPATGGDKLSEPLPVKIPKEIEADEKDCDKTPEEKPTPVVAKAPVSVPKAPEAPIDANKEPCKACKKKNKDEAARKEGQKPCARCAKKQKADKAAKAKADAIAAANEERDFPCKVCDRQKKKEAEETIPVAVNATHTTVPVVEEEIKEVTIKNETTGKEETTLEKVQVVKQKIVVKPVPVAQNATHEVIPVVEEEEQTVPEANPSTGKVELKTKKVQVVRNKVVPKPSGSLDVVAPSPAAVVPAASPAPVVNAPLEDLEKAPVDAKSAAIGAASGAKQDVASPVVVAPTVVSTPAVATPVPVVNAPLEDLEKAPVDPKSAAIGAASGAKEDIPTVASPAVIVKPSVVAAAPIEDSIESPVKPKVEKKQVVEEEEQEITRTDKKTGKTTIEIVKTPVVVEKTVEVPKLEKVQKPDIDEPESAVTDKKKENYLDDLEANLKEAFARIHKQKSDLKTKKVLKRIGKESPETVGQSEGYKEATKVVEDQELKEAESALKNVETESINPRALAKAVEAQAASLTQVKKLELGLKGKLHANFQSAMQVQSKYNNSLDKINEEMDKFSTSLNANHLNQAIFLQNELKEDKTFQTQGLKAPALSVHTVKAFNKGFSFPQIALNDFAASQIQVLKSGEEQLNQGLAEGNKDDVSAFIDLANLTSQNLKAKYGDQWSLAETKKEDDSLETETQSEKEAAPQKIEQSIAVVQKKAIANLQAKIDSGEKIDVDADTFKEINDSIIESSDTEKYDANGIEEVVA